MRKIGSSLMIAAVMTTSAVLAPPSAALADSDEKSTIWSHAQLVDGIVFGEGPVAQRLGIQSQLDPDAPTAAVSTAEAVETGLRAQLLSSHADEVNEAADLVTSGDPYKVEEGQSILADAFKASVNEAYPEYSANVAADARCGAIAACALGAILVVVAGVAVAVVAEAGVVGHAAVYATQALWEQNAVFSRNAPDATGDASLPDFVVAEMNARMTSELATRK